jgi:hypothetical protein
MAVGYGYAQHGPPQAPVAVSRVVAAGLFVLAAALTLGGTFGAFSVYRFESDLSPASTTTTTTGWGFFQDPAPDEPLPAPRILYGIPLTAAAVLALVVALLLVLSARRTQDPGVVRSLGVGSGGLLVGIVSVIWLQLGSIARNVAASAEPGDADLGIRSSYVVGLGGYLILVAALAALAAAVLLLVSRPHAPTMVPPGQGQFPPLGPGGQPMWQPQAPYWPQPGTGAPPPGWGPPAPPHR